jgi:hypothetical protein
MRWFLMAGILRLVGFYVHPYRVPLGTSGVVCFASTVGVRSYGPTAVPLPAGSGEPQGKTRSPACLRKLGPSHTLPPLPSGYATGPYPSRRTLLATPPIHQEMAVD